MKRILIPTDFSKNADNAIDYAFDFFKNEKCKYYYLHTVEAKVSQLSNLTNKFTKIIRKNGILKLKKLMTSLNLTKTNSLKKQRYILSFNKIIEAIKRNIKKHEIDVVVMGTSDNSDFKKRVYGSNTSNTIQKINNCSVLMIPNLSEFKNINQIGFPTDLKKISQDVVREIKKIAKKHNAKIKIMHIMENGEVEDFEEQNLGLLKKELEGVNYSFNTMPFYDKKVEEIIDFISIAKIDFLVIEKNKHDFIERIMREPIIEGVVKKINIPLLVINHYGNRNLS